MKRPHFRIDQDITAAICVLDDAIRRTDEATGTDEVTGLCDRSAPLLLVTMGASLKEIRGVLETVQSNEEWTKAVAVEMKEARDETEIDD